jgi:ribosome-binding factor A
MTDRLPKLNKEIQRLVGEVIRLEVDVPAGVLVTVTRADVTPNLRAAHIWLSVFPLEQTEAMFELLTKSLYVMQGAFQKKLRVNPTPRLVLKHDTGAVHADKIDRVLKELN